MSFIVSASAQIGGIQQRVAVRRQSGHERIRSSAAIYRLQSALGREVRRGRPSRYIGAAARIYTQAVGEVVQSPTQVSGVQQRGACGVELSDKRVVAASPPR